MTGIRMFFFFLSAFGWWEILRHHFPVHRVFLPGLAISFQVCLLLMGGLLSLLQETAWLLFACGIISSMYYFYREKGKNIIEYLRIEYLFLFLGSVLLLLCVQGKIFTHFDNFSHWAVAVRALLTENHLPNFETRNITFREYPMGSTVFVYYFSLLVGSSEPLQMFAQALALLSCLLPLMKGSNQHPLSSLILMLFLGNFFLSYNVPVTELLVDTLLPLAGMFTLALIYTCRNRISSMILPITAALIWVIQIKNSGLFFAGMAGLLLLLFAKRSRKLPLAARSLGIAAVSFLLWKWHCANAFPASMPSKHALSLSQWQNVVGDKSMEDIRHIILALGQYVLKWPDFWCTLLLLAAAGICVFLFTRKDLRRYGRWAGAIILMFLLWQAGLLFAYIFSMPLVEAFYLSSVDRYEKTILLAMVYLIAAIFLHVFQRSEQKAMPAFCAALGLGLSTLGLLGISDSGLSVFAYRPYQISQFNGLEARTWLERAKEKYQLPDDGDYALLLEGWDSSYFDYLGNYVFPEAADMFPLGNASTEDLEQLNQKYILIHDGENEAIQEWIHRYYPGQEGNEVIICETG